MKLLTKNNEVVEGTPISDGMLKLINDMDNGTINLALYPHQKREFFGYMIASFDLKIKEDAPTQEESEQADAALTEA